MLSRLTTVKKVCSGVLIKNRTELQELFGVLSYEVLLQTAIWFDMFSILCQKVTILPIVVVLK